MIDALCTPVEKVPAEDLDAEIKHWGQPAQCSPEVYAEVLLAHVLDHQIGEPSPLEGWLPLWPDPKPPSKPKYRSGKVPPYIKSQAKAVNILDAACWLGLGSPIKQATDEYSVICPFHEDSSPSLCLNSAKGVYFCHPCGEGGDILKLVQLVLGLNFPEAVAWLLAPNPTTQKGMLEREAQEQILTHSHQHSTQSEGAA